MRRVRRGRSGNDRLLSGGGEGAWASEVHSRIPERGVRIGIRGAVTPTARLAAVECPLHALTMPSIWFVNGVKDQTAGAITYLISRRGLGGEKAPASAFAHGKTLRIRRLEEGIGCSSRAVQRFDDVPRRPGW